MDSQYIKLFDFWPLCFNLYFTTFISFKTLITTYIWNLTKNKKIHDFPYNKAESVILCISSGLKLKNKERCGSQLKIGLTILHRLHLLHLKVGGGKTGPKIEPYCPETLSCKGRSPITKRMFTFGHCPNYLSPPPPNSGNLVLFFPTSKTMYCAYYRKKCRWWQCTMRKLWKQGLKWSTLTN